MGVNNVGPWGSSQSSQVQNAADEGSHRAVLVMNGGNLATRDLFPLKKRIRISLTRHDGDSVASAFLFSSEKEYMSRTAVTKIEPVN